MNLQESIRKDLSIFEEEKPLTFIIDRRELTEWFFIQSLEEGFDDVRDFEDYFMSQVTNHLIENKEVTIRVTLDDFITFVTFIPTHLIKNIVVIQKEHPEMYANIEEIEGLEVNGDNRHRLDIRG